ncbi:hypothetical protein [uncultured Brevundimonas sp.]|uniref:hypothetical protein n=1 Tax=uncultured Brevundimonas sp. TaxID=213418 RepID=UPI0025FAA4A8|nr:hypothetical protein [uncultured Brevundimonas sp.]
MSAQSAAVDQEATLVREGAVKVTISDDAQQMMAARGANEPEPPPTLPEILVTATKIDSNAWKAKLPAFKPWTPEIERDYQAYMNRLYVMAMNASDLVNSAFKNDGLDLNDPDQMAGYKEVYDALLKTAYGAMKNPNAFVNGPGSDDLKASDFLQALRTTDIVMMGSATTTAGEYTYNATTQRGRIEISPTAVRAAMPNVNFITAVSTTLFHELGHATTAGRNDLTTTFNAFTNANPTLSGAALYSAFVSSQAGLDYEHRTTSRGWGLAEIAGRSFDPTITGYTPR